MAETSHPHQDPSKITGAEIVIRSLEQENVKFVFGYPDGAVLHIYDAIYKQGHFGYCFYLQQPSIASVLLHVTLSINTLQYKATHL